MTAPRLASPGRLRPARIAPDGRRHPRQASRTRAAQQQEAARRGKSGAAVGHRPPPARPRSRPARIASRAGDTRRPGRHKGGRMTTDRTADGALSPELEAIAAAHDRAARAGRRKPIRHRPDVARRGRRAAIAAGARLSAIADAERGRAPRQALSRDMLRQVTRAAKRTREADSEYEQAITRARRLGLSHHEVAAAARSRTPPSARPPPAPAPSQTTGGSGQPPTANRTRSPHSRRPSPTSSPARGLASGAPSAWRSSRAPRSSRSASHSVRS